MTPKIKNRRLKDGALQGLTLGAGSISLVVLLSIFLFVFQRGWSTLQWEMLTRDYWSENRYVAFSDITPTEYTVPDLKVDEYFSERYGFAVEDYVAPDRSHLIRVTYVDPQSPLRQTTVLTQGDNLGQASPITSGLLIQKFTYLDALGEQRSAGSIIKQDAQMFIDTLDTKSVGLASAYIQTEGGGIRGSLIATLLLIIVSLGLALPIGIMSAIYLNEYAQFNRWSPWIRSSIELLTGVPSIVFGLMGVLVFFPITAGLGATGTSVVLGGMTMAVVLLPTIIRSTEESLKTVPDDLRNASLSIGANQSQTIFKIVLPSALPGILTGVLLSIGRIIGESAALIYTMGTFINDSPSLMSGGTSLAVQIWSVMGGEVPNFELASAIAIIILITVLILNLSIKFLASRLRQAL